MKNKPVIYIILSRVPFPLDKGDKLRAFHQIKSLSQYYTIHLTCLAESKPSNNQINPLQEITESLTIHVLKKWVQYWQLLIGVFSKKPFQVQYFYQYKIAKKINSQLDSLNPDFIYCQLIRVAEYVKNIHHIPKTLDFMDALSVGMTRQASINKNVRRYVMKIEAQRLKHYENRIFDYFNHHTIISEQDKQLISHTANYTINVVPNGIDDSFLAYNKIVEKKFDLVFVGNLNYAPNIDSCLFIINDLYPALKTKIPTIKILLAGKNPHEKIVENAKNIPNITVSGWVDDIKKSYLSSFICVAPLFIGTGLQNKLLESMALGIPCVTTGLANNALGAIENNEILIANTIPEFVAVISKLLNDADLYQLLSENGRTFVKANYNWDESVKSIPF